MVKKKKVDGPVESVETMANSDTPTVEKVAKVKVVHPPMEETVFDASKHFFSFKHKITEALRAQIEEFIGKPAADAKAFLDGLVASGEVAAVRLFRAGQVGTDDNVVGRVNLMCSNDDKVERVEIE